MIILKALEKVDLVADEKDFGMGVMVMYQRRLYMPTKPWECISDAEERPLYTHLRPDVKENLEEAKVILNNMKEMFSAPKATPIETPQIPSSSVGSKLEEALIKVLAQQSVDTVLETAKPMLDDFIKTTYGMIPKQIEVKVGTETHKVTGTTHEKFETVLTMVNLDIPVFLSGAAGTGKNVICKQVAEALGMDFYFTNAVTQEYQLKGFIDANGTYHGTQFYDAFVNGGLFFLDEMDGSIPETLIILNSAIANRYFDFPTGRIEANENFRIIAAGNTVGTGADIEYTGRFQLDASSLDRFALIEIDYSPAIEEAITNGNMELCEFARSFRKAAEAAGIRCLFTYRSMERIAKLETVMNLSEVIKMSLTKGMGKDDIHVIANLLDSSNKYVKALSKIA